MSRQLRAQFYRANIPFLILAILAALGASMVNLGISWLMQQILDAAAGKDALPFGTLLYISFALLAALLLVCLLTYYANPRFLKRAMKQYKDFAFEKITEKGIASFRTETTATYLSALTNDATRIEEDYLASIPSLVTLMVSLVGALLMMIWYSPAMTAVALGLSALPVFASVMAGGRLPEAEKRVSQENKSFTEIMQDCLSGFSVIKSFQAEKEVTDLFIRRNANLEEEKSKRRGLKILLSSMGNTTGAIAQLGVFLLGAYMALRDPRLTPGMLIVFVQLMNYVLSPIEQLPTLIAGRKASLALIDKLALALDQHTGNTGTTKLPALQDRIEVKKLSFSYDGEKQVLTDISASFEAGKAYAIVGASGSGKSTLLHLLMAGSDDYQGSICIDKTELREIDPESLYSLMSVIQQNVFIFNASIKDNITMFREFPRKDLDESIRRAHLTELLAERNDDFLCGEGGNALSGGEKQRISIARSLLKKSSLLLADEVTAALDAQTAHQVTSDILDLQGMTRIIVTHALEESLLRRYDGILVLKNGKIEETGTFDELMARKGYFYALFTVAQ